MDLMFAPLKKYAQFSGRARRQEYWLFQLAVCAFITVSSVLSAILPTAAGDIVFILMMLVTFAVLLPMYAVGVRRMHDTGRSGWWLLIGLVPIIGGVWQLVLLATAGDVGPNRYGPDPKRPEAPVLPLARVV